MKISSYVSAGGILAYDYAVNKGMRFFLGDSSGNQVIITNIANRTYSHDHATQTNPTLYIHSDTNPNSANDEWISFTHDKTDGIIDVGSGKIKITDPQCSGDYYSNDGSQGFTGTGAYTNFTIKNGIITAAS